jgi:hypothetical protein
VRGPALLHSCKHRALHEHHRYHHHHRHHHLKGRRPSLHVRGTRTASARAFNGPSRLDPISPSHTGTGKRSPQSSSKRKPARREELAALGEYGKARRTEKVDDEDVEAEEGLGRGGGRDGSELVGGKRRARRVSNGDACCAAGGPVVVDVEKAWSARRRDPRINGADLYVARVTKVGMGSAKPCWRCLEWCRWAGVKRIFHWNGEEGKFDMVKVNTAERDQYETHADIRLFAGMASCRFFPSSLSACLFTDTVFCAGLVVFGGWNLLTTNYWGFWTSIYLYRFCSHGFMIVLT